jgi:hypothetical protein
VRPGRNVHHAPHPAVDPHRELLPATDAATALLAVPVLAAILSEGMWRTLPDTHEAMTGQDEQA